MTNLLRSLALILLPADLPCAGNDKIPANEITQHFVDAAIWKGLWDGHVDNGLRGLGDEGNRVIAKAIADRPLKKLQIETVLEMLERAFSDLSDVPVALDRQPHAAFLLLRYLDCAAPDAATKQKIAKTREALQRVAVAEQSKEKETKK